MSKLAIVESTTLAKFAMLAGVSIFSASLAYGQDFPSKPIRIVTSAVGGGNDVTARLMAQWLSGPLGQQVIIENRTSLLAAENVAKAAPDGYTLLFAGSSFTTLPMLQTTGYDPIRDFTPISIVDTSPDIVVVHPSVPVKSTQELVALAKAKPGVLNYGSGTTGGAQHLPVELFKSMAKVDIQRIVYKGSGPALNDLLGGQVHLMFTTTASVVPHVKAGRLRALAVTSAKPSALAPDLPTVGAAVPGYEFIGVDAILAPAKTPAAVVNRINQELLKVLSRADVKEKFLSFAAEAAPSTPEELAAFFKADIGRLGKLIKEAHIRAD